MKKFKWLMAAMCSLLVTISFTSCENDEPGSDSSHDYYYAEVYSEPAYFWVIDMDPGNLTFTISAWNLNGKKMNNQRSFSGKYIVNGSTIYVTWNHQSMNTQWEYTSSGLRMKGSSNPEELEYLTFYHGIPDFN